MIVKLLTVHYLEFLSLKGGCRGSSESTHVKMPHFWKSHATAQIMFSCDDACMFIQHNKSLFCRYMFVLKMLFAFTSAAYIESAFQQ